MSPEWPISKGGKFSVASVTRNVTTLLNKSSPSHINAPKVYRPCFSSNGVPVSPNRTALTGKYSFSRMSPLSSCQSVQRAKKNCASIQPNRRLCRRPPPTHQSYSSHSYTIWLDQCNFLEFHIHIYEIRVNHQPNSPSVDCVLIPTRKMAEIVVFHQLVKKRDGH